MNQILSRGKEECSLNNGEPESTPQHGNPISYAGGSTAEVSEAGRKLEKGADADRRWKMIA